jgi:Di-haem oxidoreductase, putative peroxidase
MRKQKVLLLIVGLSLGLSVLIGYINPQKVFGQIPLPDEATLFARRIAEVQTNFVVQPPDRPLRPVERVRRDTFGDVGFGPVRTLAQLDTLMYPSVPNSIRELVLEGSEFFTTPNKVEDGFGSVAMQTRCAGCHLNNLETVPNEGLLTGTSNVSRAGRTTQTNFSFTSGDTQVNGGRAPGRRLDPVAPDASVDLNRLSLVTDGEGELDAVNSTGRTAAFTVMGDFSQSRNFFDPLSGAAGTFLADISVPQNFGGFLQHVRPPSQELKEVFGLDCKPEAIPSVTEDKNLVGFNKSTGQSQIGFRRAITELAGPPYIGRGLIEAIPNQDIMAFSDPSDARGDNSSLKTPFFGCGQGDCITGVTNLIPRNISAADLPRRQDELLAQGLGRFGLRANGAEMMQFIVGGMFGSLSMTNRISPNEQNIANPQIAPYNKGCENRVADPELPVSTPFSERNFIRATAPPEFGPNLLAVLNSKNPAKPIRGNSPAGRVQRGAQLFGVDLVAFSNRMISGRMPNGGDGLDPNAINQSDRMVGCVSCHIPVQRTGMSPAAGDPSLGPDAQALVNALSYRWAPIFSDINIHRGPKIDVERFSPIPREPFLVRRAKVVKRGRSGRNSGQDERRNNFVQAFMTYDLPRNFASDAFSNVKGIADGDQFRTPPLTGIGRVGAPFMHDARVFLSTLTRDTTPAGTVTTNSEETNAPLVVRTTNDALLAAIELHDLPAPDDNKTSKLPGGGCPVPPGGKVISKIGYDGNLNGSDPVVIDYGPSPKDVICPPYNSEISNTRRSEAREVMARFRSLTPDDQQAMIDFLREL